MSRFLKTLLLSLLLAAAADAAMTPTTLSIAPAPSGIPSNPDFTLRVRPPGGEWQEVFCYAVEVDMHKPRSSSLALFDFSGTVEVEATFHREAVRSARLRPLSRGIEPNVRDNTLTFSLTRPENLSLEVNGDIFGNLQIFAGPPETNIPDPKDPGVIHFGPGVHTPGPELKIPSGSTVYLAPGAVVKSKLLCDGVSDVKILGRGILYRAERGIEISRSHNIHVEGITVVNPRYYSLFGGASRNLTIKNFKSFSSKGWSDGIDLMCCPDVLIDGVFLRNSDDCIAIYGHRWEFFGDARNITVKNSTLWADVAHPVNIGTHGNPAKPEVLENLTFTNLDILNHDEPQISYQGCFAINASDENLVRNVLVDDVRIEDFEQGQLVNLRVAFNKKYATAPGRGIENIVFRNLRYDGSRANISVLTGYDATRAIKGVVFEDLRINGVLMRKADTARLFLGEHVNDVEFRVTSDPPK